MQAVADRLVHQRMLGNSDLAGEVFRAGGLVGEHRGEQVVGEHPLDGRGNALAVPAAGHLERPRDRPAPARREERNPEDRLGEHVLQVLGLQEREDRCEREGVQVGERDDDAVVGRRRLEFQVEGAAEALPQRESPRAVDPAPEGSVDDELHAARVVEEALGDHRPLARHGAERRLAGGQVAEDLIRSGGVELTVPLQLRPRLRRTLVHALAKFRHPDAQFRGAPRRFAPPEGDGGGCPFRVFHPDLSLGDAPDPPRGGAQQEHVARVALDGEVLVELSHDAVVGFGDHLVLRRFRDRAAVLDRGQARVPARAHRARDGVPVQEGAPASPRGRDALGEHADHLVEGGAAEVSVGIRAAHEIEQAVQIVPFLRRRSRFGDELLREDVERGLGNADSVEVAGVHRGHERRALDQFVAGGGKEPSFRDGAQPVAGAPHPLEGHRDGARRAELAREVHRADVNPQFERGGGNDGANVSFLEPPLGLQPHLSGKAPVMGQDGVFRQPLAQHVGQALRHPAGVDEDEGGVVLLDERGDPVPDVLHDLVGGDRPELGIRNFHRQVHLPPVPHGNHGRPLRRPGAEEAGDLGERPHRRREPDPLERTAGEPVEAFERERQVASPLVAGERVDLVHDHGVRGGEHFPAAARGEQQVERFGGGDQDVGRFPGHPRPLGGRGVSGAELGADRGRRFAVRPGEVGDAGERDLEVPADVGAERLQGRDVHHPGFVRQAARASVPGEPVER